MCRAALLDPPGRQQLILGDIVARATERISRCVIIAGCGYRARSAVMIWQPDFFFDLQSRTLKNVLCAADLTENDPLTTLL
jgi:hypothetical protein